MIVFFQLPVVSSIPRTQACTRRLSEVMGLVLYNPPATTVPLHPLTVQHSVPLELSSNSHPLHLHIPCFPIPRLFLGQRAFHWLYNISLIRTLSIRGTQRMFTVVGCPEQLCNNLPPSFTPSPILVHLSINSLHTSFFPFQLATVHPSLPLPFISSPITAWPIAWVGFPLVRYSLH